MNKLSLLLLFSFTFALSGCAVKLNPAATRMPTHETGALTDVGSTSVWKLNDLDPSEGIVLTDRQKTNVSVVLSASGTFNYFVTLSANNKAFGPFIANVFSDSGETDLKVKVTWPVKPKGKYEDIIVRLYRVTTSDSGQTKTVTLLEEITRRYDIICDRKKWWLIRFVRAHIFCSCRTVS